MKDIKEIEKLATEFREAIILAIEKKSPNMSLLETFPRGCCGNASDLLLYYLKSKGFETNYINGYTDEHCCHGWLYYEDKDIPYYIDITADQFAEDGITDKVIVRRRSECMWHQNKFNDIRVFQIDSEYDLGFFVSAYDEIIKNLKK